VSGRSKAYKRCIREVVERRAEVGGGIVAVIGVDNTTRCSEGPPAGCAIATAKTLGRGALRVAGVGRQPEWRRGMRSVDCPGESRMRENFMSGLGRGSRKRGVSCRACSLLHSAEAPVMGVERRSRLICDLFARATGRVPGGPEWTCQVGKTNRF